MSKQKTLADLGVTIKEIWLNRVVDSITGEVVQEFDPPQLWWKEDNSAFEPDEEAKVMLLNCKLYKGEQKFNIIKEFD